ncbi:MAG: hypothetical protein ACPGQS_00120 [Bradymonadia bacterium]
MMFRQMGGVNLDVDATFLVQLALIVLTMLVLRKLIFQPYLRVASIRDDLTTKTVERAEETSQRAEALAAEFESKLAAAKQEALAMKTALRAEAIAEKDATIDAANRAAQEQLSDSRQKLGTDVEAVREASKGMVDQIADMIVSKVLNRTSDAFAVSNEAPAAAEDEVQV